MMQVNDISNRTRVWSFGHLAIPCTMLMAVDLKAWVLFVPLRGLTSFAPRCQQTNFPNPLLNTFVRIMWQINLRQIYTEIKYMPIYIYAKDNGD